MRCPRWPWERIVKAGFESRPACQQGDPRIGRREAAVIAPAIDRTCVADARLTCHRDVFVVVEADDDVRSPSRPFVFGADDAHRQRARDLAVLVAHEDRAELQAALQTGDGGLHDLGVPVWNE
jgi:hypothetical protein